MKEPHFVSKKIQNEVLYCYHLISNLILQISLNMNPLFHQ